MRKIIVIVGPTGAGKTAAAVELTRKLNGELISADSRQVYKYLDIGTNKEGEWNGAAGLRYTGGIAQHLTDLIEPSGSFNAGEFARLALDSIKKIINSKKIPVIVGGTGLYIRALIDGLAEMPEQDAALREELKNLGTEELYKQLKAFDPESAEKNRGNPQRLIRAIEVYKLSGTPITTLQKNTKPLSMEYEFAQFGLTLERTKLYDSINTRSEKMIESGMIDETKKVLAMGFPDTCSGLQGLGYRHVVSFLRNHISREELLENLRQDTRNYAKRQLTWFNKDKRIEWIPASSPESIANRIADMVE